MPQSSVTDRGCTIRASFGRLPLGTLLLAIGLLAFLIGGGVDCSAKTTLAKKMIGLWKQGAREFEIKEGVILISRNNRVFASFNVIDGEPVYKIGCVIKF